MKFHKLLAFMVLMLLIGIGCSSGPSEPVSAPPDKSDSTFVSDYIPLIDYNGTSAIGMMGAYNLIFSDDGTSAELTPIRTSTIGESFVVSGIEFFSGTRTLRLQGIALDAGRRPVVKFKIRHPFPKGTLTQPVTWLNRLDLDVFDVALVIQPVGETPSNFTPVNSYPGIVLNPDGYTTELANVIADSSALPYMICYKTENNNRFEMGTPFQQFDVVFDIQSSVEFNLFLTMGYGASAIWNTRLNPTYYVPEFNRKAAWKIDVFPPTWVEGQPWESLPLIIDIYDWNHGVTVDPGFPDPLNRNQLSQPSDVISVSVDIPAMINTPVVAYTTDTEFNGWDNPLTYKADIANVNNRPEGSYYGLVCVTDSRVPNPAPTGSNTLIHFPDGTGGGYQVSTLPEYATYQVFSAVVAGKTPGYRLGAGWGSGANDAGNGLVVDSEGNLYFTGYFQESVDFDPGPSDDTHTSHGFSDVFLVKFDHLENFQWAKTFGGSGWDSGMKLAVDSMDNVYLVGFFEETVDFDPNAGTDFKTANGGRDIYITKFNPDGTVAWNRTLGGPGEDECHSVSVDSSDNVYTTGFYEFTVDFNTGSGTDNHTSNGGRDIYLNKFNSNGDFIWAKPWGAGLWDEGHSLAVENTNPSYAGVYVTGFFEGTVDFNPHPIQTDNHTSMGQRDIFVSKFNEDGTFGWAKTFGSSIWDEGHGIAVYENSIFVTGYFQLVTDFDPEPGGSNQDIRISNGGRDIFLSKFNNLGEYQWSRTWGGMGIWDEGFAVAAGLQDTDVVCLVTGSFELTADFNPDPAIFDFRTSAAGKDIFLSKFESDGDLAWALTWEGLGIWDEGHSVGFGSFYFTGCHSGITDMDPGPGEKWNSSNGFMDVLVMKMKSEGADEIEPNDECYDLMNNLTFGTMHYGSVRNNVDDVDYWSIPPYQGLINVSVINDSGYNIDVFVIRYCYDEVGRSENPGGADEFINGVLLDHDMYEVMIISRNDGYTGAKNYRLRVDAY